MDKRGQFTFYRSFWEAIKVLPKKDRLPIYEAITEYALDGTTPSGLTQSQSAFFSLVKPNLDASRKKAANGKQGGSKPKANRKQTATESEKENEIEVEIEEENEIEKEYECIYSSSSSRAGAVSEYVEDIALRLFTKYAGRKPTLSDIENVYGRVKFGDRISTDAVGLLDYAFASAAKAGLGGNWNYINAVLDRCNLQDIYTAADAMAADLERESDV